MKRAAHDAALVLALIASSAGAEDFSGKVVGVSDGDTISVMRHGGAVKVRLHGIDCPEAGQYFTNAAKKFTSAMVFGQVVNRILSLVLSSEGKHST